MGYVVRLTEHGGQYRVTIPRKLVEGAGLEGVLFVSLHKVGRGKILIREYYGERKEKRDLQKD